MWWSPSQLHAAAAPAAAAPAQQLSWACAATAVRPVCAALTSRSTRAGEQPVLLGSLLEQSFQHVQAATRQWTRTECWSVGNSMSSSLQQRVAASLSTIGLPTQHSAVQQDVSVKVGRARCRLPGVLQWRLRCDPRRTWVWRSVLPPATALPLQCCMCHGISWHWLLLIHLLHACAGGCRLRWCTSSGAGR